MPDIGRESGKVDKLSLSFSFPILKLVDNIILFIGKFGSSKTSGSEPKSLLFLVRF
jgi:hypothetical protein